MKNIKAIIIIYTLLTVLWGCSKKESSPADTNTQDKTPTETVSQTSTPPPQTQPVDPMDRKAIAEINEQELTNGSFKAYIKSQYAGIADSEPNPRLLSRLFDSFMERKIVAYMANKSNVPMDPAEIRAQIDKLNKNPRDKNDPPLDKKAVEEDIRIQKYLYHEVYNNIEVSDKEITDYYKKNLEDYRKKKEILLHQILVKNREDALKIRAELNNYPSHFSEIAKAKSISPEAKNGGEMGYFEEGTLPKDMEKVVFSLNLNSISPVVESSYGFHIFKITRKKRSRLLYLNIVKPEIKNKLLAEKLRTAYKGFLEQTKNDLDITINYKNLYFEYFPVEGEEN